jgi:hypothetical protein
MKNVKIIVRNEDWSYQIENGWTTIFDPDGECALSFIRRLSFDEVLAAIEAYLKGVEVGTRVGEAKKLAEIDRVLSVNRS